MLIPPVLVPALWLYQMLILRKEVYGYGELSVVVLQLFKKLYN